MVSGPLWAVQFTVVGMGLCQNTCLCLKCPCRGPSDQNPFSLWKRSPKKWHWKPNAKWFSLLDCDEQTLLCQHTCKSSGFCWHYFGSYFSSKTNLTRGKKVTNFHCFEFPLSRLTMLKPDAALFKWSCFLTETDTCVLTGDRFFRELSWHCLFWLDFSLPVLHLLCWAWKARIGTETNEVLHWTYLLTRFQAARLKAGRPAWVTHPCLTNCLDHGWPLGWYAPLFY